MVGPFAFYMNLVEFLILALATWRIANMIVDDSEDGPFDVLHWIRFMLGERGAGEDKRYIFEQGEKLDFWWSLHYQFYRAFSCMWCASFWIGFVIAVSFFIFPLATVIMCTPFALSAGAIVISKRPTQ